LPEIAAFSPGPRGRRPGHPRQCDVRTDDRLKESPQLTPYRPVEASTPSWAMPCWSPWRSCRRLTGSHLRGPQAGHTSADHPPATEEWTWTGWRTWPATSPADWAIWSSARSRNTPESRPCRPQQAGLPALNRRPPHPRRGAPPHRRPACLPMARLCFRRAERAVRPESAPRGRSRSAPPPPPTTPSRPRRWLHGIVLGSARSPDRRTDDPAQRSRRPRTAIRHTPSACSRWLGYSAADPQARDAQSLRVVGSPSPHPTPAW